MICDYHVHTDFSDDSFYPMEDAILEAISLNIQEICFTDHVDYGVKPDFYEDSPCRYFQGKRVVNPDYEQYFKDLQHYKEKYQDKIIIKKGLEFGMQSHTIPQFQKVFANYPLDFVILSIHQVDNLEFWTQDYQKGKSQKEYNEGYYLEMLRCIQQYKDYSVLGHLDMIVRYDQQGSYPFVKIKDIIAEILKTAIKDDKGIELNTSCFKYKLKDLTPSRDILKLYLDLGGKIITLGSDSHDQGQMGAKILQCQQELKNIGFKEFCTFEKMKPIFHSL